MVVSQDRWPRKPLGDVADVASGYAFKSSEFREHGIPVIKIKNVRLGAVDLLGADCVDERHLAIDERYHVGGGDVLVSLTGSHISQPNSVVGRVARHSASLPHCLLNQRVGKVVVRDVKACDIRFLFYALSEPDTRLSIAMKANGAANQANVSPSQVESVQIPIPPLRMQQRIADVLLVYDELIENSQQRFRVLEAMSRNLYQHCLREEGALARLRPILEVDFWKFISANVVPYEGTKRYLATADVDNLVIDGPGTYYTFEDKPSRAQKQPIPFSVWFARMKDT